MKVFNINNKDGTPSKLWIMVREPLNEAAFRTIKDMYTGFTLEEDRNPLDKEIPTGVDVAIVIFNHGRPSIGMVNVNPTIYNFPSKKSMDDYFLRIVETSESDIITDVNSQSVEALVMVPHENETDMRNNGLESIEEEDGTPINQSGEYYRNNTLGLRDISPSGRVMGTILTALLISELYQNGKAMIKKKEEVRDLEGSLHEVEVFRDDEDGTKEEILHVARSKNKRIKKLKIRW